MRTSIIFDLLARKLVLLLVRRYRYPVLYFSR